MSESPPPSLGGPEKLRQNIELLRTFPKPVDAVLALGMGPVRPQLRGRYSYVNSQGNPVTVPARVIADFERMRAISIAVKELAMNSFINPEGTIIPSGRATANPQVVEQALLERSAVNEAELVDLDPKEHARRFPNIQVYARFMGRPLSQEEADLIKGTTEAGLMADLIQKAVAKQGPKDRKTVSQKIELEQDALNSNQNAIRALNLLDQTSGGVWDGTLGVVTSNFGHIARSIELLQIMGITKVAGLSAEQILRHFGYSKEYLDRYESLNVDLKTLKEQERWRRAVRKEAGYVLHDVQFFENDKRLMQVMGALRNWYGVEKLAEYGLDKFEELTASKIRSLIQEKVNRKEIVNRWLAVDIQVDETAWREEIKACNASTEQWLTQ